MTRLLSFASGMGLDVAPAEAAGAAAAAGFDAVGFRFDAPGPSDAEAAALRRRVDDLGLAVLDIEYVKLTQDDEAAAWHRRLVELGAVLGAQHLLSVSYDADRARSAERFATLAAHSTTVGGPRIAVEFMVFSEVPNLAAALDVVARTGHTVGILVDALHLSRSGGSPADLAAVDPILLPYLQLCDAPPDRAHDDLLHEARHLRLLPGDGALPLTDLLAAAPADAPLSLEVLSDDLKQRFAIEERARVTLEATRRVLAGRP